MNQSIQILLQCRSLVCCSDQFNCLLACLLAWIAASTRDTKCNVCICYKIIIALCLNNSLCVSTNYPNMVKCRINIIKSSWHSTHGSWLMAHGIQLSTFGFQPCHLQYPTRTYYQTNPFAPKKPVQSIRLYSILLLCCMDDH